MPGWTGWGLGAAAASLSMSALCLSTSAAVSISTSPDSTPPYTICCTVLTSQLVAAKRISSLIRPVFSWRQLTPPPGSKKATGPSSAAEARM